MSIRSPSVKSRYLGVCDFYGWFGGGSYSGGTHLKTVDRITLAYDTTNAIDRCDLTVAGYLLAGFTNNIYGWFGGGMLTNVVDRITIANDTVNAIDRCDMSAARGGLVGFAGSL